MGPEGQMKFKQSSALIIGLGGLGIPAAVYLASAGVGRIGLVDLDHVNMANLQRQFLYSQKDVGRRKVDVVAEKLADINPNVRISSYNLRLESTNAMDVIREYDVIMDATDNIPTRYLINDACVLLGKPDVYAGVLGFDGQASVFNPPRGPCYRCLFPKPPVPDSVKSCEEAGVLNVVPGIMGTIQASQAIAIFLGKGAPLIGRLLCFNGRDNYFDEVKFRKNSSCAVCGSKPTISELIDYEEFCGSTRKATIPEFDITTAELKTSIDSGKRLLLLDVREPFEYSICHIEPSTLIPLEELSNRAGELKKDDEIVVYCHVGIRSASAVTLLRQNGYSNVRNLQGGIEAWALRADPKMPRY